MEYASLREETLLPRRIEFTAAAQPAKAPPICLDWRGISKPFAGLRNVGNTCFLNSALQCLLHTPPVANAVHECRSPSFCALCCLRRLQKCQQSSVVPQDFIQNLRMIGKQFHLGRQEDSHEFLRCLMEKLPKDFVQTTFRGQLRSLVRCQVCRYESETLEDFLDLSLELSAIDLHRCLANFCREEVLDGCNKYFCVRCQRKVVATKQFSIRSSPPVLTIHFKRFTNQLRKDTRSVNYSQELDLSPFCGRSARYRLYAVLVHQGATVHSGHYYAFVQAGNQLWYEMNDSNVSPANAQRALSHGAAYILFYKQVLSPTAQPPQVNPAPEPVFRAVQTAPPLIEDLSTVPLKRLGPSLWKAECRLNVLKHFHCVMELPIHIVKPATALALGYVKDEYDRQLDRGKVKKVKMAKRAVPRSLWDNAAVHS